MLWAKLQLVEIIPVVLEKIFSNYIPFNGVWHDHSINENWNFFNQWTLQLIPCLLETSLVVLKKEKCFWQCWHHYLNDKQHDDHESTPEPLAPVGKNRIVEIPHKLYTCMYMHDHIKDSHRLNMYMILFIPSGHLSIHHRVMPCPAKLSCGL